MPYKLELAKSVMEEAHKGQTRWDGKTHYSVHPIKVVQILQNFNIRNEDILISAYLHDVLEDTDYPLKKILEQFGQKVVNLVNELSFFGDHDDESYWNQVKGLSTEAKIIKLADILANLTDDGKKSHHFILKRTLALQIIIKDLGITKLSEFRHYKTPLRKER